MYEANIMVQIMKPGKPMLYVYPVKIARRSQGVSKLYKFCVVQGILPQPGVVPVPASVPTTQLTQQQSMTQQQKSALDDLDKLGQSLLQQSLPLEQTPQPRYVHIVSENLTKIITDNFA